MKQIRLFGAGKSATVLIDYLLEHASSENWSLQVVDADLALAQGKINQHPAGLAVSFDIHDDQRRKDFIDSGDLVISMLPPGLHSIVARDCLASGKHLLTASYVDDEMRSLQQDISSKGILFLCEMGLDPGIDHMSAMQIIDGIRQKGGDIHSFKSHCGGLVAPESDNNPWHYKISWNPRNIIMAGKAGAHYREHNTEVRLTHQQLFDANRTVEIPSIGKLSWYPNRDSLSYEPLYGMSNTSTFIRTTLRHADFMHGWHEIVHLGLTDETVRYDTDGRSFAEVFREHIDRVGLNDWLKQKIEEKGLTISQLAYLGLDDQETIIDKGKCSPADILQFAVERRLALQPTDKDMIVMLHEFDYKIDGRDSSIKSSLVSIGEDSLRTAMAKTVGLPLGIATRLVLNGSIAVRGLHIPNRMEFYLPVLAELAQYGIRFEETRD